MALSLFLLCWGLGAVAMAVMGLFHWWTVFPISGGLFGLARRWLPEPSARVDRWWTAIFLLVISLTAVNVAHRGEHLLTGLDSGTYLATAGWLAEDGSLLVDAEVEPLADIQGLRFDAPGFYDRADGRDRLEPQFMHAFPAMIGSIIDLGGVEAGLVVPPLIAAVCLLALYSLARRVTGPAAAALSVALLGSSLVFVYYARTPFTELLMATFVLSGLSLLFRAEQRSSVSAAALAGGLFGGAALVRLDGIVLLLPVTAYILVRSRTDESLRQVLKRARSAMFLVAFIGAIESLYIAPAYILERRNQVVPILLTLLFLILTNDLVPKKAISNIGHWIRSKQRLIFGLTCLTLALLLAYGWFIRPQAGEPIGAIPSDTVTAQEQVPGLDPTRDYFDNAVIWLTWYQGPAFLVLGFFGAAVLARRGLRGDLPRSAILVAGILVTFSILYFWRPQVTPYQIWAMRRFVTIVIPLGCLVSALAVESLYLMARNHMSTSAVPQGVAALLALVLFLPSVAATAPVWDHHEYEGFSTDMDELCGDLPPGAHVLIDGADLGTRLTQSFRSYCGMPAAWAEDVGDLELERPEESEANLYVVSLRGPGERFLEGHYERLELTLDRRPNHEADFPIGVFVRPAGS
ncbi:MAG TPA: glycosyltransferase family 39 protein [Acidimicrobiia bacterium]|nr:glycosyltransferase family 39 protein [Acidimicrobiia bacterium]